jgi:hypothetical protein
MNEGQTELLRAVARVVATFGDLGIDYLIGGSVASSVFGEPRQTVDADLLARVLGRHVQPLADALSGEFYLDRAAVLSAIERQGSFNLIHLESMSKVDVFVSWRTPFAQSQFARRKKVIVGESQGPELFFATPEDTILAKLEWFKKGGGVSDRQWRDILGVIKVQGKRLDGDYLLRWGSELGLGDLLEKALRDAGQEPL